MLIEFQEKLQELRKQKNLIQEELFKIGIRPWLSKY